MTETFFKAVRPDGLDFATQTIDYGKAAKARSKAGRVITHPSPRVDAADASRYLSVATVSTDCTGFKWPAQLLEVEAIGDVWTPHADTYPNKRAVTALRIIRKLPAWQLFGPEGERIVSIIDQYYALTDAQREALRDAYMADYDKWWKVYYAVAYGGRAGRAGLGAARGALVVRLDDWRGGCATCGAALALLCRSLVGTVFTQKEYDALSAPWRKVMGEIHPDDKAVK